MWILCCSPIGGSMVKKKEIPEGCEWEQCHGDRSNQGPDKAAWEPQLWVLPVEWHFSSDVLLTVFIKSENSGSKLHFCLLLIILLLLWDWRSPCDMQYLYLWVQSYWRSFMHDCQWSRIWPSFLNSVCKDLRSWWLSHL